MRSNAHGDKINNTPNGRRRRLQGLRQRTSVFVTDEQHTGQLHRPERCAGAAAAIVRRQSATARKLHMGQFGAFCCRKVRARDGASDCKKMLRSLRTKVQMLRVYKSTRARCRRHPHAGRPNGFLGSLCAPRIRRAEAGTGRVARAGR